VPRIAQCPETEEPCDDDRCSASLCSMRQNASLRIKEERELQQKREKQRRARLGSMKQVRRDAAWRVWFEMATSHNKAVNNGGSPVVTKAGNAPINLAATNAQKEGIIDKILSLAAYADRIEAQIDSILSEHGVTRPIPSSVDLL
jgi:hypothetical protein